MTIHKIETTLTENGTLILNNLPFRAGELVEVSIKTRRRGDRSVEIIIKRARRKRRKESSIPINEKVMTTPISEGHSQPIDFNPYPLRSKQPYSYEDPFNSATSLEDWEALQ